MSARQVYFRLSQVVRHGADLSGRHTRWPRWLRLLANGGRFPMPVTRDQAQMIATLATNCRPHGARHE